MATFVTNTGLGIVTNRIKGAGTEPNFVAWGTSATAAAAGDTALGTESSEARTTGTSTRVTTTQTNDTYQVVGAITATATRAITEAGLLDASTAGNIYVHSSFTVINLAVNDSIQFTFKVQYQ